jgi:hypothetical protein
MLTRYKLPLLGCLGLFAWLAIAASAQATDHFIVQCSYSHSLPDDPIVYPGQPGASHLHDFVGNATTDANSTYSSLLGQPTTCGAPADTAAYWMPAMWIGQTRYVPKYARAYYSRDAPAGVKVVAFPANTQIVAGDKTRTTPSPGIVSFSCGASTPGDSPSSGQAPYDCKSRLGGDDSHDGLVGRVLFPHCWDGVGNQQADFMGYTATCPLGWKYVPRIRLGFHYFACGANATIWPIGQMTPPPTAGVTTFGSMPGMLPWTAFHADFFNSWNQSGLTAEINKVLNVQPNNLGTFDGPKVGDPGTPTC